MWRRWCSGRRRPRPPARLGPHFVRRRASKPARALRTLRRPPHQWCLRCCVVSARPRHRPRAPQVGPSPATRPHEREKIRPARLHERNIAPAGHSTTWLTSSVKEISPLLAQNGQNTALFAVQGRRIFHGTPQHLTQGRFFFHPSPSPTPQAGQNSPCSAPSAPTREKIRPAPPKLPKISAFSLAGRIFSRSHPESTPVGRVFSRRWVPQPPHNTRRPPHLKPMTPMRVDHCHEMKPLTPLLAQKSQFQAIFRPQRCHGFHAPLAEHQQRRRRFHPRRTLRPQPKSRVACAKTATSVAHWPHD